MQCLNVHVDKLESVSPKDQRIGKCKSDQQDHSDKQYHEAASHFRKNRIHAVDDATKYKSRYK